MEIDNENNINNNIINDEEEINNEQKENEENENENENEYENNIDDEEEEIPNELLNEKLDIIMKKLEDINIEKEIGEKYKKSESRIIIEKIILENFKSYAGKKIIGPLHFRFNSVVGPNGSGKSNLMESLLFVFGKRAKKMRLSKLSELIHNSSKMNKCNSAKVSIYFREIKENNNENDEYSYIPNGDFVISREVYKNNSSKYYLNNSESTFDKIHEILSKKGIDLKHNRFLILQGEVEQIALMKQKASNPNETGLLEFLEDIIGTKRYVNLIERLNKSIEELSDIKTSKANRVKITKNELNQLEDVKNQSMEYYKKEKEFLIYKHLIGLIKIFEKERKKMEKQEEIQKITNENLEIKDQIQEKLTQSSDVLLEYKKIKKSQDEIKKRKEELEKETNKFDEEDKIKRAEIENYQKTSKKIDNQLLKLNKNYQNINENIANATEEKPKLIEQNEKLKKEYEMLDNDLMTREKENYQKTQNLQKQKSEIENKLQPYENKINMNNYQIQQNKNTINLYQEKFKKTKEGIQIFTDKKNSSLNDLNERQKTLLNLTNTKIKLTSEKDNLIQTKQQKLSQAEEKQKELNNLMSKLSELRNSNQELNTKNNILRSLILAQEKGQLTGILGRLGDLGSIDSKYDCAITTSCSHLDDIVVKTVDNAQKALDYLKKNNIGKASFLILEKITWVENIQKRNFQLPAQNCQRLFDLIRYTNPELKNAFYFAMRDTLVTDNIKNAMKIAYGTTRHRVVTLNGELIEIVGTMQGGGKPRKGGMSNTQKNINNVDETEIKNNYQLCLDQYNQLKNEYNAQENLLNKTINEINNIEKTIQNLEIEINNLKKIINDCENQLTSLNNELNKYTIQEQSINELNTQNDNLMIENNQLNIENRDLKNSLEKIIYEIDNAMGEDYNKKKQEHKQLKKTIEENEKNISNFENILNNANISLQKSKEEIEQKEKSKQECLNKIKQIENELEDLDNRALAKYGEIEACDKEIKDLDEKFNERSSEIERIKELINQLREAQEKKKNELKEINEEVKKINRAINQFNDEVNANKISFNNLINEFGFIDDIDTEIQNIKEGKFSQNNSNLDKENNNNNNTNNNNNNNNTSIVESSLAEKNNSSSKKKKSSSKPYLKYLNVTSLPETLPDEDLAILSPLFDEIIYSKSMLDSILKEMKPNMSAISQYKNTLLLLKERETDLNQTIQKLRKANDIFSNVKMKRYNEFMDGFSLISNKLKDMYQLLTNGGDAELELVDTLDPFNEGISFSVRPFKKSWKIITNLSGGEKTLASLSLIFALHHYKPSPLYVMDEIDAALDFRNVSIIANYIKDQTKDSQFIIISLRNHMFELANKLIGIYKTFDITKTVIFDPNVYDVLGNPIKKISYNKNNSHSKIKKEEIMKNNEENNSNVNNNVLNENNINNKINEEEDEEMKGIEEEKNN